MPKLVSDDRCHLLERKDPAERQRQEQSFSLQRLRPAEHRNPAAGSEKGGVQTHDNVVRTSRTEPLRHPVHEGVRSGVNVSIQKLARDTQVLSAAHRKRVLDEYEANDQAPNRHSLRQGAGHTFPAVAPAEVHRINEHGGLSHDEDGQGNERNTDQPGKDESEPTPIGADQQRGDPEYNWQQQARTNEDDADLFQEIGGPAKLAAVWAETEPANGADLDLVPDDESDCPTQGGDG